MNMTDDLVIDAFNKAMINRKLNKDGIFILIEAVNIHQMISNNY